MSTKEELKYASIGSGVPFVMTTGTTLMLQWSVHSWDSLQLVTC